MMWHSTRELKLGHTAEVNGHLAAHNILREMHGEQLLTYPRGVTGAATTPKIYCLSLGRYDAVMGFNGLVLRGWYVAVMKWLLEWTKVAAATERPVGILFWRVADGMSTATFDVSVGGDLAKATSWTQRRGRRGRARGPRTGFGIFGG